MRHHLPSQRTIGLACALFLLTGCTLSSGATPGPGVEATSTLQAKATPTMCTGWTCTLQGTVYVDAAEPGNKLPGAPVNLTHVSYCSPTTGEHSTVTGLDGTFHFQVYLHDTDTFWFQVEERGYEPVRLSMGGFDCLYCSCPPLEIVLKPNTATVSSTPTTTAQATAATRASSPSSPTPTGVPAATPAPTPPGTP
jgi:hypothetical protein